MSELSPAFFFAPYHSLAMDGSGSLGDPFPSEHSLPKALADHFIHVFGEGDLQPVAGWKLVTVLYVQPTQDEGPVYAPVIGSGPSLDQPEVGPGIVGGVRFPVSTSNGLSDRKYFVLALPRPLDLQVAEELAALGPLGLPVVSLKTESAHFRHLADDGPLKKQAENGSRRVLLIVNPYVVLRALLATYEWRADRPVRWTVSEAGYDENERLISAERLARLELALEIETLRRGGVDVDDKLADDGKALDELLRDYDPTNRDGALAKMFVARELGGKALISYLTNPLMTLLDRDARLDEGRAKAFYAEHLSLVSTSLSRLPECDSGSAFFTRLEEKFPPNGHGQRAVPRNAAEVVAKDFLFADEKEEKPSWHGAVAAKAIRSLWKLHGAAAALLAANAVKRLKDLSGLAADADLSGWAKLPLKHAAGLSAYRWAYHLRSAYQLERVEVEGVVKTAVWTERALGTRHNLPTLDVSVNWDTGEWQGKFPELDASRVDLVLSTVNLAFTVASLQEALEAKQGEGLAILKTSGATLSLLNDPWVSALFSRLNKHFTSSKGINALKVAGALGSFLGTAAGLVEARTVWRDTGEGDVMLALGATALGGMISFYATAAPLAGASGPPGWVTLTGLTLALVGPLLAALVTDDDVEKMASHSTFGKSPGAPHVAPKVALCEGNNFSAWAASGKATVVAQREAFCNLTWAFGVQGALLSGNVPTVELLPQRLVGLSAFHVLVNARWGNLSREVSKTGSVWLHVGAKSHLHLEHDTGARFNAGKVGHGAPALAATGRSVRWSIELATASEVEGMELREMTLEVLFASLGKQGGTMVPAPTPADGRHQRRLTYRLVFPNSSFQSNSGAEGQSSQNAFVLEGTLVLSTAAYS